MESAILERYCLTEILGSRRGSAPATSVLPVRLRSSWLKVWPTAAQSFGPGGIRDPVLATQSAVVAVLGVAVPVVGRLLAQAASQSAAPTPINILFNMMAPTFSSS